MKFFIIIFLLFGLIASMMGLYQMCFKFQVEYWGEDVAVSITQMPPQCG